jgi:predicted HTH domain antitoxin
VWENTGMSSVSLELPEDLVRAANMDRANVSASAARLIALELFREGSISLGRAAELSATPLAVFMDFVAAHGVSPLRYGTDEFEEDLKTLETLRA